MKAKGTDMKQWIGMIQEQDRLDAMTVKSKERMAEKARIRANQEAMDFSNRIYDIANKAERHMGKYNAFKTDLKNTLVCECIYCAYDKAIPEYFTEDLKNRGVNLYDMKHGFVEDMVNEQGVDNIIKYWRRTRSPIVEAYMEIVDKTYKEVLESVDKKDDSTFGTPTGVKDQFFSNVSNATPADVTETIKTRVLKSVESFLDDHREMKNAVTDIYNSAQTKIAATNDDALKEEYTMKYNRAIKEETSKKPKSVFSEMCMQVGKNIMYTDELREQYLNEDGRLDTGSVIGVAGLMYTLLETCNTMKLINVDKEYIGKVLDGIAESTQQARRKNRSATYRSVQEQVVSL